MNTPTTPEGAAETFRCEPYTCTLTGRACALTHVKAVQTQAHSREHCITCEAGAARARLLDVGQVRCRVPNAAGVECGHEPEQGRAFCRAHRFHRNLPPSLKGEPSDKFQARPAPPAQREVFRPTGEVRETKRVAQSDKPCPRKKPSPPVRPARTQANCLECGWERSGPGTRGYPNLVDWCGKCLKFARQAMAHRDIENTPEAVEKWLRTPKAERPPLVSRRPPCARCGIVRGASRPGHPLTEAWCTFCLDCARQALYRRGVRKGTPEQLAEVMRTMSARKYGRDGDPMAEIRAAVARALAAGVSVEDIRAELARAARPAVEAEAA